MMLSIVSPVYLSEKIVEELVKRITQEVSKITDSFEIILVEDGGSDGSWSKIEAACQKDPRVKGIKLTRNFGQHFAITAGLDHAQGQWVVVMDSDLQDNPKYIPEMLKVAQTGDFDVVFTKKLNRNHPFLKNLTAKFFYTTFNYLSDTQSAERDVGCYSLLSRKVVDAFVKIKDAQRHYLMVVRWLGFRHCFYEIEQDPRYEGKSAYNWGKLLNHAIDGITSQSNRLLRHAIIMGFAFASGAVLFAAYSVFRLFYGGALAGWTSLMVAILLSTGIILIALGVVGIYIGQIFEQTKGRPLYLISRKRNL